MATQLVTPYQQQYSSWEQNQQSPYDQQHLMPMNMYSLETSLHTSYELPAQPSHQCHQPRPSQSTPWTPQEDELLLESKRKNLQWDVISKHFPEKSGNACRKRYERLENKRRGTDWDASRLQSLAVAYMDRRQEIWGPLAKSLGEKWEHVEKKVIEEGIKNLANKASYHTRHTSASSSRSHRSAHEHEHSTPQDAYNQENQPEEEEEDEDSGIGLGPGSAGRRESRHVSSQHGWKDLDPRNLHNLVPPAMYHQ